MAAIDDMDSGKGAESLKHALDSENYKLTLKNSHHFEKSPFPDKQKEKVYLCFVSVSWFSTVQSASNVVSVI